MGLPLRKNFRNFFIFPAVTIRQYCRAVWHRDILPILSVTSSASPLEDCFGSTPAAWSVCESLLLEIVDQVLETARRCFQCDSWSEATGSI